MWPITVKVLQDQDKLQIAIQLFSAASIFFASIYASTYQLMKDRRGRTDKIRYIHGYLAMLEKNWIFSKTYKNQKNCQWNKFTKVMLQDFY